MLFGSKSSGSIHKKQAMQQVLDEMLVLRELCFLMKTTTLVSVSYFSEEYKSLLGSTDSTHLWYYVCLRAAFYRRRVDEIKAYLQKGADADEVDKKYYNIFFDSYAVFDQFKKLTGLQIVDLVFDYLFEDPNPHGSEYMILYFPFFRTGFGDDYAKVNKQLLKAFRKKTQDNIRLSAEEFKQLQVKYARPANMQKVAYACPSCRANLCIPTHTGKTEITCPKCKCRFIVNNN